MMSQGNLKQKSMWLRAAGKARKWLARFTPDERGSTAVVAAFVLPAVVGGLGLGAETGYWYLKQRKLQHAADLASHAAAVMLRAGGNDGQIDAAALRVATTSGYAPSDGTIEVNTPPTSGPNAGNRSHVEVLVRERHPRMFTALFSGDPVDMAARAVSKIEGGADVCVLALSKSARGAVTVSGSTTVDLADCSVASNSTAPDAYLMSNSASYMSTDCVYTVGGAVATTGLKMACDKIKERSPVSVDPYADIPDPDGESIPCRSAGTLGVLVPLDILDGMPAMRLCGGLDIKANQTLTLSPGIYIIEGGPLNVEAQGKLVGNGVTLHFTKTSSAKIAGGAELELEAPRGGPYEGLLVFGSREASGVTHEFTGNTGSSIRGSIYTPASKVIFTGNSSMAATCTQIVADTVTFTGNSEINLGCGETGMKAIVAGQTVAIVE